VIRPLTTNEFDYAKRRALIADEWRDLVLFERVVE
jgi:hypothetical protein